MVVRDVLPSRLAEMLRDKTVASPCIPECTKQSHGLRADVLGRKHHPVSVTASAPHLDSSCCHCCPHQQGPEEAAHATFPTQEGEEGIQVPVGCNGVPRVRQVMLWDRSSNFLALLRCSQCAAQCKTLLLWTSHGCRVRTGVSVLVSVLFALKLSALPACADSFLLWLAERRSARARMAPARGLVTASQHPPWVWGSTGSGARRRGGCCGQGG